eukprot:GGOE01049452.1.p1 GENE.GGOE01049452.1~~GGOE01049452.1.p1  ORF type:complete len:431 (-),score=138.04 GGOE01049452.1:242-1375(-)
MADIQFHAKGEQTPVSPSTMTAFARHTNKSAALLHGALFLHRELPFRLAMRVQDLDSLPRGLMVLDELQMLRNWYTTSFKELRAFHFSKPNPRSDDEPRFHDLLDRIFDRHIGVPKQMALACVVLRRQLEHFYGSHWEEHPDRQQVQDILQRFFLSRIGIRFLLEQQITLHRQVTANAIPEGMFGLLSLRVRGIDLVNIAVQQVQEGCRERWGAAPKIEVHHDPEATTPFVHIPRHIDFIVRQMLQHAVLNHVERYGAPAMGSDTAPSISVVVADGPRNDHLSVRVEDHGHGMPRSQLPTLWSYLHQEAEPLWGDAASIYGLPLARLTAEYFGGRLTVVSLEGCGTSWYVHMRKMTEKSDQLEQLPVAIPRDRDRWM